MIKKCMMIMAACLCLAACSTLCDSDKTSIVTIDNLLDEMLDRDAMTRFPESGYVQKQVSSYDRRSIAPDQEGWFANVDGGGYERLDTINGRLEKVMLRMDGGADNVAAIAKDYINLFLLGKPGTGKTKTAYALAAALGLPIYTIAITKNTEEDTFEGMNKVIDGKNRFFRLECKDQHSNDGNDQEPSEKDKRKQAYERPEV